MAAPLSPVLNLNGYTDLPAGKIANIVTYLEMRSRPRLRRLAKPPGWSFVRLNSDRGRYRAIFRRVGEPWLWFSRTVMSDAALAGILATSASRLLPSMTGRTTSAFWNSTSAAGAIAS